MLNPFSISLPRPDDREQEFQGAVPARNFEDIAGGAGRRHDRQLPANLDGQSINLRHLKSGGTDVARDLAHLVSGDTWVTRHSMDSMEMSLSHPHPVVEETSGDMRGATDENARRGGDYKTRLWRHLVGLDQRFASAQKEKRFKDSLEEQVLHFGMLVFIAGAVMIALAIVPKMLSEDMFGHHRHSCREEMTARCVRNLTFLCWLCVFLVISTFAILAACRLGLGWFRGLDWELLFTLTACLYAFSLSVVNFWHFPILLGLQPTEVWSHNVRGAEVFILLALDALLTVTAMYVPIRSCLLWALHLAGVGTFALLLVSVESMFPEDRHITVSALLALSSFAWHGAYRNEKIVREKWDAEQLVHQTGLLVKQQEDQIEMAEKMVKGLRTVAETFCDMILQLSVDLYIADTHGLYDAFFGMPVTGLHVTDLLSKSDKERFTKLVRDATGSHAPVCMPFTLQKRGEKQARLMEVDLFLVDTGGEQWRYMLGIHFEAEQLWEAVGAHDPGTSSIEGPDAFREMLLKKRPSLMRNRDHADLNEECSTKGAPGGQSMEAGQLRPMGFVSEESDVSESEKYAENVRKWTPLKGRALSLQKLLPHWNIEREATNCCQYHTVLQAANEVVAELSRRPCNPLWSSFSGAQCSRCRCMFNQLRARCLVCGLEAADRKRPDCARATGSDEWADG